ncbi:hypothetical protein [Streptomyces sp. NPDC050759]|uniref:hypothetical protein n=1 Tax=Streptomyces sp. NPDC050759 TaxID=3365635 RepID=UPI0037AC69A9
MLFGSANRDPRKWPEPDTFDIGRAPMDHVGFGSVVHACAGQGLRGWRSTRSCRRCWVR